MPSKVRQILLACAVALACAPQAQAAAPDLTPRPADYPKVAVDKDVPITMRDGVRLYADVRRPAGEDGKPAPGRFPVVLTQTPYNKANSAGSGQMADLAGVNDLLVTHGYVQVIVDVRGTGASEGAWDSFGAAEQADSLEIANWATSQPWSDRRLALYGASYMAINQFFTAAQHPRGLKAMFPVIPSEDVYRDVTWHGGAVDSGFIPLWLGIVGATKMIPPGYSGSDPEGAMRFMADRVFEGLNFPVTALTGTLGSELAYDGPFYRLRSPGSVVDRIKVPTFITGGWFDIFQRGEPRLYRALKLKPGRKQLMMGPWYHVTAGDGLGQKGTPPELKTIALAWFDRWVKGRRNGVEKYGPVHVYENGTGRWVRQRYYPRRDLAHSRLYLAAGGGLGTAAPKDSAVETASGPPVNGLCSRNTVQWTAGLVPPGQPCETDNRAFEAGALTYTTAAMDKPLHVQGPIGLTLRGSTTAKDATWVAVVSDVDESGKSTQLTAGWLLSSRRAVDEARSVRSEKGDLVVPFHPFTQESLLPVEPDETETLNIEIFNTDAVIKPGHRLRLTIAQGDVPHMLAPAPSLLDSAGGRSSVHIDPANPSFLTLPAVPRR